MLIKTRKIWEMPESLATPEHIFMNRRQALAALGAAGAGAFTSALATPARAEDDPSAGLYPLKRNDSFVLDRPISAEKTVSQYNNFYEFGSDKRVARAAQALKIRPWTVKIDGLVEKEQVVDIDQLLKAMPLEERLYRFRCVEAWSMAVPWSGFPVSALLAQAKPLSAARYMRFETFLDPASASGQKQVWYPWPYVESISMAEAANDLAFLVTGVYGKPLAKQFGAPLRLALPWKYGFKSIKSITRISFVDKRPVSFWEKLQSAEYGFWANVNPEVPHPRWSQAREQFFNDKGDIEQKPTLLFNGYGEQVAGLYKGLEKEKLWV